MLQPDSPHRKTDSAGVSEFGHDRFPRSPRTVAAGVRNYGETVAHLVAPTRYPYQFARNCQHWANRMHEAPFDAHLRLALMAPRPLLPQTGNTDKWSDPYVEFSPR